MDHHRLSNKALGERLDIAHTTVGRWLSGESVPQDRLLRRLAGELRVDEAILSDDNFDLPEGTTTALYKGEYEVTPERAAMVREGVEHESAAKMWEAFAPALPELVQRIDRLVEEALAIRAVLLDYAPESVAALSISHERALRASLARKTPEAKPHEPSKKAQSSAGG